MKSIKSSWPSAFMSMSVRMILSCVIILVSFISVIFDRRNKLWLPLNVLFRYSVNIASLLRCHQDIKLIILGKAHAN